MPEVFKKWKGALYGEKKSLPMGMENFERIRNEDFYYIDKTGLIKDLLEDKSYVTLFTRPRRFGKTHKTFFSDISYRRCLVYWNEQF